MNDQSSLHAVECSWGHVQQKQRAGQNPANDSEFGIIRDVPAGVAYNSSSKLKRNWRPVAGQQRYFFALKEETLEAAQSLREFHGTLKTPQPSSQRLEELDRIAHSLLDITARLHEENRQLGMATGDNVVWLGSEGIVLFDHGFHQEEQTSYYIGWIENKPPDAELWEAPIAEQQYKALPQETITPAEDVRLLIRLFQGLVLGVWQKSVVKGEEARKKHLTKNPKLWTGLAELESQTAAPTLDQLRQHLRRNPLSSHFQAPPKPDGNKSAVRGGWFVPVAVLAAVVLVAALGITYALEVWPFEAPEKKIIAGEPGGPEKNDGEDTRTTNGNGGNTEEKTSEPNDPPEPTPAMESEILKRLAQAPPAGSLQEFVVLFEQLDQLPGATHPDTANQERDALSQRRSEFYRQWESAFAAAREQFDRIPTREAAYASFVELRDQLKSVLALKQHPLTNAIQEKGKRCLESLQTLKFNHDLPDAFLDSL